jgi:sec-independent protein translocase protein TatC
MVTNSDFNFTNTEKVTLELPFSEHIEELRQRIFHTFWIILFLTFLAFIEVKFLVQILELPVDNVKFFSIITG